MRRASTWRSLRTSCAGYPLQRRHRTVTQALHDAAPKVTQPQLRLALR